MARQAKGPRTAARQAAKGPRTAARLAWGLALRIGRLGRLVLRLGRLGGRAPRHSSAGSALSSQWSDGPCIYGRRIYPITLG